MSEAVATSNLTFKVNVRTLSEHLGCSTDYAVIEIDVEMAARIRKLHAAVKELQVAFIHAWDYTPDFFMGEDFRLDGHRLVVSDNDFGWHGWYKHGNEAWETDTIPITLLDSEPGSTHDLRDEKIEEEAEDEPVGGEEGLP